MQGGNRNGLHRQPRTSRRGRPLHVRPRLRPAVPGLRLRRGGGRASAARSSKDILTRAVKFTGDAQIAAGAAGTTPRKADGGDIDEGSVTITQVQALRAARNAGIAVPKEIIKKAHKYLKDCTSRQRRRHLQPGAAAAARRPAALTAAAIACLLQRRRVQGRAVQEVVQVLPATPSPSAARRRPHRPRRVHPLLLRPGDLHPRRRRLRQALPRARPKASG